jgi:hypothetical protein
MLVETQSSTSGSREALPLTCINVGNSRDMQNGLPFSTDILSLTGQSRQKKRKRKIDIIQINFLYD